ACPTELGYTNVSDFCFKMYYNIKQTRSDAATMCAAQGSRLVKLDTLWKNEAIMNRAREIKDEGIATGYDSPIKDFSVAGKKGEGEEEASELLNNQPFTIGAADKSGDLVFVWDDGTEVDDNATYWRKGDPSNVARNGSSNCLTILPLVDLTSGIWRVVDCLHYRRFICEYAGCGDPPAIPHSQTTSGRGLPLENRTYTCDPGYVPSGNSNVTCLSVGYWNQVNFSCNLVLCGEPPVVLNADKEAGAGSVGSTREYVCRKGFCQIGNVSVTTCTTDGGWSEVDITCTDVCKSSSNLISGSRNLVLRCLTLLMVFSWIRLE
ncbi:E-selectin-like, partial [Gigantopelta aegis]|uniref:E-selectin-like n=1 Tax=Gigantopelta aegis TaxID=1735272 RepID=UPI001B88785F